MYYKHCAYLSGTNADEVLLHFQHTHASKYKMNSTMETYIFIQKIHELIQQKFNTLYMLRQPRLNDLFANDNNTRVALHPKTVNGIRILSFCDRDSVCTSIEMLHIYDIHEQHFADRLSVDVMSLVDR